MLSLSFAATRRYLRSAPGWAGSVLRLCACRAYLEGIER